MILNLLNDTQNNKLSNLRVIIERGDFDLAVDDLNTFSIDKITDIYHIKKGILKNRLLIYQGNYEEAFNLSKNLYNFVTEINNKIDDIVIFEVFIWHFEVCIRSLDQNKIIELMKKGKMYYDKYKNSESSDKIELIAYYNYCKSLMSLESFTHNLKYQQKLLENALERFIKIKNIFGQGLALNNIGYSYFVMGDMVKSLEYHKQALILREKLENTHQIAYSHANLGIVYRDQAESKLSLFHLNEAYTLWLSLKNYSLVAEVLWNLTFHAYIFEKPIEILKNYYKKIIKLDQNNLYVNYYSKFCQAIIFKMSNRIKIKYQAVDILEELISRETNYEYSKLIQIELLVDLLLDELKLYAQEEVLTEIRELLDIHYNLTKNMNSIYYQVSSLLLKSKLSLIEGNLKNAISIIDKVHLLTNDNNLIMLKNKAQSEKKILLDNLVKWNNLINNNLSMYDRIKQTNIESYLKIIGKVHQEIND